MEWEVVLGSKLFKADRKIKLGQQTLPLRMLLNTGRTPQGLQSNSAEIGDRWSPCWSQMNLASLGFWRPGMIWTDPPASLGSFGLEQIWAIHLWQPQDCSWGGQDAREEAGGKGTVFLFVLPVQLRSAEAHWVPVRLPWSLQKKKKKRSHLSRRLASPSHAKC